MDNEVRKDPAGDNGEASFSGLIVKGVGGLYSVLTEGESGAERILCDAKGAFRRAGITPTVGDRVRCGKTGNEKGVIKEILPRKNVLIRPACANVDRLVIVACESHPAADLYMLDKLTAVAEYNGIEVLFVFNKSDICYPETLLDIYTKAGCRVMAISAAEAEKYRESTDEIKSFLKGHVTFIAGASGVGKTSLVNLLFPDLGLVTGDLSRKISRGKHTTRATELYRIDRDTFLADTPGFSSFEVAQYRMLPKEALLCSFPEILAHSEGCTYSDCTHTGEGSDVCLVKRAVESGEIPKSRHESFVRLYKEIDEAQEY